MIASRFSELLLEWHAGNDRDLPWKASGDPYKIWISEIILQQTRVAQGIPYYNKFVTMFPTVDHLASASEDAVLKAWEGLGYYTRARNMHAAAQKIVAGNNGLFPDSYKTILELPGVGAYTAAAIASFAFNLPNAVVDGNVYRVLSRLFGVGAAIDSTEGRRVFSDLAHDLLDKKNPAAYNQALMNFGSLVCTPAIPCCAECIFKNSCFAYNHDLISAFPRKLKRIAVSERWFNFLVIETEEKFIIEKRNGKDIWKGLFQFPLIETTRNISSGKVLKMPVTRQFFGDDEIEINEITSSVKHRLTHQQITARFIRITHSLKDLRLAPGHLIVKKNELKKFPFPKLITNYLKNQLH